MNVSAAHNVDEEIYVYHTNDTMSMNVLAAHNKYHGISLYYSTDFGFGSSLQRDLVYGYIVLITIGLCIDLFLMYSQLIIYCFALYFAVPNPLPYNH